MLLSFAIISLPTQHRTVLHSFFSGIYAAIIAITRWIVGDDAYCDLGLYHFVYAGFKSRVWTFKSLALYLTCVLLPI